MNTRSPFPVCPAGEALRSPGIDPELTTPQREPLPESATADNSVNLSVTAPRFDMRDDGQAVLAQSRPPTTGPRQRRFEFDAKVIRDSVVRKLRSVDRNDLAQPLDNCHRTPSYKRCTGCRSVKTFYNRCERNTCPICAGRLARDRRETVQWWSKVVNQPKHIVLTVASVDVLSKTYVQWLKNCFRKLRKQTWAKDGERWWTSTAITPATPNSAPMPGRKRRNGKLSPWKGRAITTRSTAWRGGFWSIDVTHGAAGWHVHFHIIADADWIDRDRLEHEWAKLTGQEMAVVRVYDVRNKDYTAEVTKYVCDGVQMGNWPAEKIAEFGDTLLKERCFDTFGCLYKQRAEWTAAKEEMHRDKDVCECGCAQWQFFDESEWEWQQIKGDLAPPVAATIPAHRYHPELFTPPSAVSL